MNALSFVCLSISFSIESASLVDVNVVQFFARIITWRYQILIIIMTRYWLGWMQIFWRHIHFAVHCNETAWKVSRPLQKKSRKNHEFIRIAFRSNYKWEEFSLNKIIFFSPFDRLICKISSAHFLAIITLYNANDANENVWTKTLTLKRKRI